MTTLIVAGSIVVASFVGLLIKEDPAKHEVKTHQISTMKFEKHSNEVMAQYYQDKIQQDYQLSQDHLYKAEALEQKLQKMK